MVRNFQRYKLPKNVASFIKLSVRTFVDKKTKVPYIQLNDGNCMPALGIGTWESPPGVVTQAIKDAIDVGFRHIDGAYIYQNEREVGKGINCKIKEGVVKRSDLFITTKLWNTFHNPEMVRCACERSLKNINTPYVDMYLIHWPMGWKEGDNLFPTSKDGKIIPSDYDYVDTWKEMEKLVDHGLTKSIGISNFNHKQVERILKVARIPPATNQIECHPYLNQKRLMKFCKSNKKIIITSYSPLGSPKRPMAKPGDPVLMEDKRIKDIAKKHEKTPAQILIRYQLQRGNIVIPKSVTKSRIVSNFNVFDFKLCSEDMDELDKMDCNARLVEIPRDSENKHYPFHEKF